MVKVIKTRTKLGKKPAAKKKSKKPKPYRDKMLRSEMKGSSYGG